MSAPLTPTMMIGNIAQNGIRNRYRNHPMPGVMTPTMVKSPMTPKMKAPSNIRIGHGGRSGSSMPENATFMPDALDVESAAGAVPLSSSATMALTPLSMPPSKSLPLDFGVISLRMMRLAIASVSVP